MSEYRGIVSSSGSSFKTLSGRCFHADEVDAISREIADVLKSHNLTVGDARIILKCADERLDFYAVCGSGGK